MRRTGRATPNASVYGRPGGCTGSKGLSWLYRAAPARPAGAAWDDGETAALTVLPAQPAAH